LASLYKPSVTTYQLADGKHRTPDGMRVTRDTPGAVKVSRKSQIWYGKYKAADGSICRVPLCTDKTASKQMLAKLVTDAKMAELGMVDAFEKHRTQPLSEHLEDFARALCAKGCSDFHVKVTVERARRVIDGCGFCFITDLSASRVQEFIADLRISGKPRTPLEAEKGWYTLAEAAAVLHAKPAAMTAMIRRHALEAEGQGRRRRYPRATVQALQERLCRGRSVQTINFYLAAIKQFCRWLVKDRRMGDNPLAHLSGGNVKLDRRHDRRALPLEELQRLLESAQTSPESFRNLAGADRAMLYATAMGTGFRASELASLTPASFDLDTCKVRVEAAYSKNRREAIQPIPADLADALRGYLAGKPAGLLIWAGTWPEKAAQMVRKDLTAADIPYETEEGFADFHALRHSYITLLAQCGVAPKLAQELARHSDIRLTMNRYAHIGLHSLEAAVESLPPILAVKPSSEALAPTGTDGNTTCAVDRALTKPVSLDDPRLITHENSSMQETAKGGHHITLAYKILTHYEGAAYCI
jgi:integrase